MIRGRGYVGGEGPLNPEIAIVGQSIGKYEIDNNRVFAGPAGGLLDESLELAGLKRKDIYITNVLKYQPAGEIKLNKWEDTESVELLWEELQKINPQKIIVLGAIPLYFLTGKTGISEHRGSILRSQRLNKVVIPTYNPAHLLYQKGGEISGYWQKHLINFDIQRAKKISPNFTPPYRNLHIAKNSVDVYKFFERNKNNKIASCDIEVIACIPCCISFSFIKTESISIPLFREINGIPITTIPELDLAEIWRIIDKILREKEIDGQNFKFDQERLEQELCFKIEKFRSDTMLKAAVLNPELPKSQAFLTSILTEEPYYKDEGKDYNPKRDKIDRWLLYNAKDSAVNREISDIQDQDLRDENLHSYYYDYYHHLHDLYYQIELIGLNVDENQRKNLIDKYKEQLNEVNRRLELVLGWLPKSVAGNSKDLHLAVYETLRMPKRESLDEDSLVALGANHCKTAEQKIGLQSIIERRRLEKVLGPDRLNFKADHDGKARTSFRITGTETGRSSTTLLRPPLRRNKTGLSFQTMSKHGDIGHDFRTMFVPPKDFLFANLDLSQADARVVAILAKDYDLLKLFDLVDIHKFTAAIYLELPITRKYKNAAEAVLGKDEINQALTIIRKDERFVAKFVRHGVNYDMQKRRLMVDINTNAKKFHINTSISEWKAGQLLDRVHNFSPNVREIFHREIKEAINNTRELVRPDGSPRTFFGRLEPETYREGFSDIPQHTVSRQVRRAALESKKEMPDLQIVIESYDALTIQAHKSEIHDRARIVQKYMRLPIDFSKCSLPRGELIIPSECEIGPTYGDLEKVEL